MSFTSSGSSTSRRDVDNAPCCLPGLRAERVRDDRFSAGFLAHGASDDGGREKFDESADSCRFNSTTRSVNTANIRFNSSFSTRNSAFSARQPSILRGELVIGRDIGHDDTL
jgi:hypothetical protein